MLNKTFKPKIKLLYYLISYLSLVTLLNIVSSCDGDATKTLTDLDTIKFLSIEEIEPNEVSIAGGTFDVTINGSFYPSSSGNADLIIKKYPSNPADSCLALDTTVHFSNREPITIRLNTNMFRGNCDEPETYYLRLFSTNPVMHSDLLPFYFGHVVPSLDSFKISQYRMESANDIDCNAAIESFKLTFNNPDVDLNYVSLKPLITNQTDLDDQYFEGITTINDLAYCLDTFMTDHHAGNDTFQIVYALGHDIPTISGNYPGVSNNFSHFSNYKNWSFVFLTEIENILHSNWYEQSGMPSKKWTKN